MKVFLIWVVASMIGAIGGMAIGKSAGLGLSGTVPEKPVVQTVKLCNVDAKGAFVNCREVILNGPK